METRILLSISNGMNNCRKLCCWNLVKNCVRILLKNNLWKEKQCRILIPFRVLAVLIAVACQVFDVIVLTHLYTIPNAKMIFFWELTSIIYDIAAMIYASGAAVYGTTVDALVLMSIVITNCILTYRNCPDISQERIVPVLWVIRALYFVVCVELTHRNFTKFHNYKDVCQESARTMLLQAILFSFTILILQAPALKTVYDTVIMQTQNCTYQIGICGIPEFYHPRFNPGDPCEEGFIEYIGAREKIRLVRVFIYIHLVYYSILNKPFFECTDIGNVLLNVCHVIIICGLTCLVIALVWSCVAPFYFVTWPKKYLFDSIEAIIFTSLLIMLLYKYIFGPHPTDDEKMKSRPTIVFGID